jgi:hypothetical protein
MCLAAVAHLVEHDRLADLGIDDPRLAGLVAESWRRRDELPSHSTGDELGEDLMTVAYLEETAQQAGLETAAIPVEDIGWDRLSGRFVGAKNGVARDAPAEGVLVGMEDEVADRNRMVGETRADLASIVLDQDGHGHHPGAAGVVELIVDTTRPLHRCIDEGGVRASNRAHGLAG